ncbi:hypothetical protein HNQ07_001639 [Deinococcus metalli]|uniref:Uncharacterized protein n=1 Tax=Deinococcus metalli TaxID=1141878 RepID=A0A7W8KDH6_9DEIO|nr:hypothetical protein [Deinococcus metalli]MBB5376182.1 hypothetical protein [Deinococcus metalli]GHF40171.1 hypothetical protein GCM10017781_15990 [Deinococcus metalli]
MPSRSALPAVLARLFRRCPALRWARALLPVLLGVSLLGVRAGAVQVGTLNLTPPSGWTVRVEKGVATLMPAGGAAGVMLVIPDQTITGDARAWFTTSVGQLSSDGQVTERTDVQVSTTPAGASLLTAGAAVRLAQGTQYRAYIASVSGTRATLYVLVAPSREVFTARQADFVALVRSGRAPAAGVPAPATGGGLTGPKAALPAVKPMNAAQFVAAGGDPATAVIPDEFRCYQEKRGSGVTPELVLQILPGGKYRTPYGAGSYTVKRDGSLTRTAWTGGVLDGASGYLDFGDDGQQLSLHDVGEGTLDDASDFECYQRGPRENRQLLDFKLRTPAVAAYPCTLTDGSGRSGGTLEILAGGAYRLGGQSGHYSVDFRSDQDQEWSDLEFTGGALQGASGTYGEDATGLRTLRVYRPRMECTRVVKPTPLPRYGAAKAPAPPRGSGGLSGAYATWYPDPLAAMGLGGCSGLCWDVYVFDKAGYVFTAEPDASLDEADCTRTHPNGLPVCEVYRAQGGQLVIGRDKPVPFAKAGAALKIDGRTYQLLQSLAGVKLSGTYTSDSFVGGGASTVSGAFRTTLTFLPQGKFTRERSGGVSATTTDTGTNAGTVTGGATVTSERRGGGTYRVTGFTVELTFGGGHVEKLFGYALPGKDGWPQLDLLRLGGSTYTTGRK